MYIVFNYQLIINYQLTLHVCSFRFYSISFSCSRFETEFSERFILTSSIRDTASYYYCCALHCFRCLLYLCVWEIVVIFHFVWNLTILSKLFTLFTVSINAWYIFKWRCCIMMPVASWPLQVFLYKHTLDSVVRRFQSDTQWWVHARAFVCVRACFHVCVCVCVRLCFSTELKWLLARWQVEQIKWGHNNVY